MAAAPSDHEGDREQITESCEVYSIISSELNKLKEECTSFSFLAAGKTGAGKSTLLNALTETEVFNSCSDRRAAGTKFIFKYEFERNGVTITAWDSPGFEDSSGREEEYKQKLREHCSEVDLMMYCISLKETRSDLGHDASALKQITEALSPDIWKKSVFVLTFANKLESRLKADKVPSIEAAFSEKISLWKEKVQEALREAGVEEAVVDQISLIPAGHYKRRHLPGQRYWLSNLWFKVYHTVRNEYAQLALQRANEGRFVSPEEAETSSPYALILSHDNVIATTAGVGAGVVGAAVGGTTGALIGALAIGIPTFGVAAGVGLVLGLAVGGGIGGGIGGGAAYLVKTIREKRRKKRETVQVEADTDSISSSSSTNPTA